MTVIVRKQLRALFRLFLFRAVDAELLSSGADPEKLLGQMVTILLSISVLVSVPFLFTGGRLPESVAAVFEHFFIATTMLVVGLFAVLSWETVFPERRDVLVMASLPVSSRTIFMAKMAAIGAGLGVAVGALNGISGLLWPWMFAPVGSGFVGAFRAVVAFWGTLLVAAIFIFGAAVTLQGALAVLLPRQVFLRFSAGMQVVVLCALVSVYVLEPSLESKAAWSAAANHRLLAWLPSYWFWGMFQRLNEVSQRNAGLIWLAERAWVATGLAVGGAAATGVLNYFRSMQRVVEEPEIVPRRTRILGRFANPMDRAVLSFAWQTITRSRRHRMIVSFYMGAGFGVMLILLRPAMGRRGGIPVALLAASALMLCTAVAAMRTAFSMPTTLEANWVFRATVFGPAQRWLKAVRRSFLLLAIVPLWSGLAVLLFVELPSRAAVAHLVLLAALGVMLTDFCMGGFRKIPFTCSYQPGKANVQFAIWGALVLLPLALVGAKYEWHQMQSVRGQLMVALLPLLPAIALRWWTARRLQSAEEMIFDDIEEPPLVSLELAVDSALQVEVAT